HLAARDVDAAVERGALGEVPRQGRGRTEGPRVRGDVVDVDAVGVVDARAVGGQAAAYDVDLAVDGGRDGLAACDRQRGARGPGPRDRVVGVDGAHRVVA